MTKVISGRLSDAEQEAAVEMANILGESLSEFVHNSIMNRVCLTWNRPQLDASLEEKIRRAGELNDRRFLRAEKESILVTWSRMLREEREKKSNSGSS